MERVTGHSDLQDLLGAYALDAVEPDEAERIERHLELCPRCRTELREHREVAALLGYAGATAPAGLWDRITASLEEAPPALRLSQSAPLPPTPPQRVSLEPSRPTPRPDPPLAPVVPIGQGRGRGRRTVDLRLLVGLATVAAVMVALLGIQLGRAQRPSAPSQSVSAVFQAAADTPGAHLVTLKSPDNSEAVNAVILPDGRSYLGKGALPPLAGNQTYQLWGVVGADRVSLGVTGPNAEYAAFSTPRTVSALAMTVEDNPGGVVTSTKAPVVAGSLISS